MGLANFTELKASIKTWMKRDGLTDPELEDFIKLAETRFNREIRSMEMESREQATLSGEYLGLPADFLALRKIHLEGAPDKPLRYLSPLQIAQMDTPVGPPGYYTIVDMQFQIFPIGPGTPEIVYYQRIPALSATNPTNWLLTKEPDLYLFGSLVEACAYSINDDRATIWEARVQQLIVDLNVMSNAQRHGGLLVANLGMVNC